MKERVTHERKTVPDGTLGSVCVILLGAAVTALFTNDGAALTLTPIVLSMVRALNFPMSMILPYIMASGFIADTASLPLIVSNLVNIVSADFFGVNFMEYASRMIVPNLFSVGASLLMLILFYRKQIPDRYDLDQLITPDMALKDKRLFRLSWYVLGLLLAAYIICGFIDVTLAGLCLWLRVVG